MTGVFAASWGAVEKGHQVGCPSCDDVASLVGSRGAWITENPRWAVCMHAVTNHIAEVDMDWCHRAVVADTIGMEPQHDRRFDVAGMKIGEVTRWAPHHGRSTIVGQHVDSIAGRGNIAAVGIHENTSR